MFDFSELDKSKDRINKKIIEKKSKYEGVYNQGLEKLENFKKKRLEEDLKSSAKLFFEAIKIDRKKIEPYIWLAYIFYITDKDKLCLKYIKIAEEIDKNNHKLKEIKSLITGNSIIEEEDDDEEENNSTAHDLFGLKGEGIIKKLKILFNLYMDRINFNVKVKDEQIILFKQGDYNG